MVCTQGWHHQQIVKCTVCSRAHQTYHRVGRQRLYALTNIFNIFLDESIQAMHLYYTLTCTNVSELYASAERLSMKCNHRVLLLRNKIVSMFTGGRLCILSISRPFQSQMGTILLFCLPIQRKYNIEYRSEDQLSKYW